jgi:hypothetical protein
MRRDDVVESPNVTIGIGHRLGSSATLTTVTFDCSSLRWLGSGNTDRRRRASGIFQACRLGVAYLENRFDVKLRIRSQHCANRLHRPTASNYVFTTPHVRV